MFEPKIRKVGNSAVMTQISEVLAILGAKEGSLKIMAHDPALVAALQAGEGVMGQNRDLLQARA